MTLVCYVGYITDIFHNLCIQDVCLLFLTCIFCFAILEYNELRVVLKIPTISDVSHSSVMFSQTDRL